MNEIINDLKPIIMRVSEISKVVVTANKSLYESVPKLDDYRFRTTNIKSELLDVEFGMVYYMVYSGRLTAFRVVMVSVYHGLCLCEMPDNSVWVNLDEVPLFRSKEHYFRYLEGLEHCILLDYCKIPYTEIVYGGKPLVYQNGNLRESSFKWSSSFQKPELHQTKFDVAFVCSEGYYFNVCEREGVYATYEACVKSVLDGMEVVEFGSVSVSVEVKVSVSDSPIVHTLKFVES